MLEACPDGDGGGRRVFLVDGFPRNLENISAWDEVFASEDGFAVGCVLFFDCPEDIMTSRLIERGMTSGRVDDNAETIRKRFSTFRDESYPIVTLYESGERKDGVVVKRVMADRSVDTVYQDVLEVLQNFL